MRGALTIDEQSFGPEHPKVAGDQNNLAPLLKAMNRLAEAEPLMRRMMEILLKFAVATDHQHPHLTDVVGNFAGLLKQMGRSPQEVLAELNAVGRPFGIRFCRIPQIRNRPPARLQRRRADLLRRSAGLGQQGFRPAVRRVGARHHSGAALNRLN